MENIKSIVLILLIFLTASSFANDNCILIPANFPSIEQCCKLPELIRNKIVKNCELDCRSDENPSCADECYLKNSGIIENGKVNKTAILNEGQINFIKEIISDAVDKCENSIDGISDAKSRISALINCIKKETSKECTDFKTRKQCNETEKYFEDCMLQKINCSLWPRRFLSFKLTYCCAAPNLFSINLTKNCGKNCDTAKDYQKCFSNCLYDNSELIVEKSLNKKAVENALNENRYDKNVDWSKVYEIAIDESSKYQKEFINGEDLMKFERRLKAELRKRCIDFKGEGCYGIKKFNKLCPDTIYEQNKDKLYN
ncbi:hypothetical protein PVAND_016813 [Polypedilum vanderplanki]|uniref:Uncharacterized protein n=1 Tax=Polypedilum vanderplanki TaxID=319348 RepID=A0A9J6BH36_POLVA|nr:hypothetical protein PVAND_016813 [Polypedilum vanderplanki]